MLSTTSGLKVRLVRELLAFLATAIMAPLLICSNVRFLRVRLSNLVALLTARSTNLTLLASCLLTACQSRERPLQRPGSLARWSRRWQVEPRASRGRVARRYMMASHTWDTEGYLTTLRNGLC